MKVKTNMGMLEKIRCELGKIINAINGLNECGVLALDWAKSDDEEGVWITLVPDINHHTLNKKPWLSEWYISWLKQTFCEKFNLDYTYYFRRTNNRLVVWKTSCRDDDICGWHTYGESVLS